MASKNVETFRAAHQAFNRRDFDACLAVLSENVVYQDNGRNMTIRGREGFRQFMEGWVIAFSDAEVSDPVYIDGGNTVVAQFIARGLNDGPFGSLPASGRQMQLPMCEVFRFDDNGQMISGSLYYDQLSLLTQLGHIQQPTGASATAR